LTDLGLKTFNKLYPMMIKKYKDLIIDQNTTEKDKINQIIVKLNTLGKLSNDVVRDWNTVYQWAMNDGLATDVNNKLEDMRAKGEINDILNNIFNHLAGDLTELHTSVKDTLVNAINEVDDLAKQNQTDIETNTADIETNTANIATNTSNIASNAEQLALSAYYLDNEPIIAGESDWTGRLNRAIINASQSGKNVLLSKPVYDVSGTIWLKSNVALISFWGSKIQGHGVTEILKTDGSTIYNNIKIIGIEVDAGKVYRDDNLLICSQFNNVTGLTIINSKFTHSSAGIGLDTCTNVFISENTFTGMYQQTNAASQFPGSYGYGITVVECENVFIKHNIIGVNDNTNKGWVDRHAVYVSTKGTKDSYRIFVEHNSVVMKDINSDTDAETGWEYALKTIGGNEVYFEHNHVLHGLGGMFLEYENTMQSGNIYIKHNEFIDIWKCANKVMPFDTNSYTGTLKRVEIIDNYFQLKGTYATGYDGKNIYEIIIKDNTFISTYADPAYKNACYFVNLQSNHNTIQATNIFIKDNILQGFKNVGYINNTNNFYCEDTLKDYPTPFEPFQYIENVSRKTTKLKYIGTPYLHKKDTYAGLIGLSYYDTDLGMDISCLSVSPINWVNSKGEQVVAISSARPNQASIKGGFKFWEQDNSRVLYWTGFTWSTLNVIVQDYDTLANIKAISASYLNYSSKGIYATDTKKMVYWDAYANAWKDASGNVV
jgi:hypothetical protein